MNLRGFVLGTIEYHLLPEPLARGVGHTLPWIELLLSVALICGIALSIAGLISALLLATYIAAVAVNLHRGRLIECNCHGIAGTKTISQGTIIRNTLLLLLAGTVTVIAVSAPKPSLWLISRENDYTALTSGKAIIILLLLLSFCFVTISLSEWVADLTARARRIKVQ